jgi:hypothetical protein
MAEQIDASIAREIEDMIKRSVSSELLAYITHQTSLVVPCLQNPPPRVAGNHSYVSHTPTLPPLAAFVGFLVSRSGVRSGTLLASLVFLKRLAEQLAYVAKGMPCTPHRIFLATVIVASKAIHDASPKNKWWARYAAHFSLVEVNMMEKQLLKLMVSKFNFFFFYPPSHRL